MKARMMSQIEGQCQVTLETKEGKYHVQFREELTIWDKFDEALLKYNIHVNGQLYFRLISQKSD